MLEHENRGCVWGGMGFCGFGVGVMVMVSGRM